MSLPSKLELELIESLAAVKRMVESGEPQVRPVHGGMWTEVTRMLDGKVHQTQCCCKAAGTSRANCGLKAGHRGPCRCDCHRGIRRPKV